MWGSMACSCLHSIGARYCCPCDALTAKAWPNHSVQGLRGSLALLHVVVRVGRRVKGGVPRGPLPAELVGALVCPEGSPAPPLGTALLRCVGV